jgi:hypothetical protein
METYRLQGLKSSQLFISHEMKKLAGKEEVKQTVVKMAKEKAPCLASFTEIIGKLSWMNKLRFLIDFI